MNSPLSKSALLNQIAAGEQFDYIFFWGHRPLSDDRIGASCMSQWYETGFTYEDEYYPTAEHWMMAEKARLFKDEAIRTRILQTPDPRQVKALGRQVKGFQIDLWESQSFQIVVEGNTHKFSQNLALRDYLLRTELQILVEASPYDTIWGIGLTANDAAARNPHEWRGQNKLGFALMVVRANLALKQYPQLPVPPVQPPSLP